MIVECAVFHVEPGREEEFAEAISRALDVIRQAEGLAGVRVLARGVESPSDFLLIAEWESIEAHTQGFRESDLFTRWREIIGPFFAGLPDVSHYEPIG